MKELKQIGYIHFYVSEESEEIFSIIKDICSGIEPFVSAIKCNKNCGEIEFKYSPSVSHYSIRCVFNKHYILLIDTYHPLSAFKFSGLSVLDAQKYNEALYENHQISCLFNKVQPHLSKAFLKANKK